MGPVADERLTRHPPNVGMMALWNTQVRPGSRRRSRTISASDVRHGAARSPAYPAVRVVSFEAQHDLFVPNYRRDGCWRSFARRGGLVRLLAVVVGLVGCCTSLLAR
jgi:hypothetical protein